MPRPPRKRRIQGFPDYWSFSPEDREDAAEETVILTLDEYEAIRLMDREGLTQEQCARQMGVGRTTVTAIYDSARKKLARAIVDGTRLRISGGSYRLPPADNIIITINEKGIDIMRIAVTYENGEIFQHFGRTPQFKIYDAEDGKIVNSTVIDTGSTGHGALAAFLKGAQADAVICGGIGGGARMALAEAGVKLCAGVTGSADEAAAALAAGTLQYETEANCDHHGEGHEEGHSCGRHGEGHGPHGEGEGCGRHGEGHGPHGEGKGCGRHGEGHGPHGEGEGCGRHGEGHGPHGEGKGCGCHGEGHGHHGEGEGCGHHGEGHGPHGEGKGCGCHGEGHGLHGEGEGRKPHGEDEPKTEE